VHLVNWKKNSSPKQYGGLGILSAREANTSLLGKLVWSLVHNDDKLWVNLLSSNYSCGSDFLFNSSVHRNSSPIWSSIIRAKDVMKNGYTWRAGSCNSSFWYSNWSTHGILSSQVPFVDIHNIQLSVHDVITNDGHHTQRLYTSLPPDLEDTINNTRILFNPSIKDVFMGPHNKNNIYSNKSGYNWLLSSHAAVNHQTVSWNWIWRLKAPEKIKFLIWLALP